MADTLLTLAIAHGVCSLGACSYLVGSTLRHAHDAPAHIQARRAFAVRLLPFDVRLSCCDLRAAHARGAPMMRACMLERMQIRTRKNVRPENHDILLISGEASIASQLPQLPPKLALSRSSLKLHFLAPLGG